MKVKQKKAAYNLASRHFLYLYKKNMLSSCKLLLLAVAQISLLVTAIYFAVDASKSEITTPTETFNSTSNEAVSQGSMKAPNGIQVSSISEYYAGQGVTISGILLKGGMLDVPTALKVNIIDSHTVNSGVTVSGVSLKGNTLNASIIAASSAEVGTISASSISASASLSAGAISSSSISTSSVNTASVSASVVVKSDVITEYTAGNGVAVGGVLLKTGNVRASSGLTTNAINEISAGAGVTVAGVTMNAGSANIPGSILVDTIDQRTAGHGVLIGTVLIKNGTVYAPGGVQVDSASVGSLTSSSLNADTVATGSLTSDSLATGTLVSGRVDADVFSGTSITSQTLNSTNVVTASLRSPVDGGSIDISDVVIQDGNLAASSMNVDSISANTTGSGVNIEGVVIQGGSIMVPGVAVLTDVAFGGPVDVIALHTDEIFGRTPDSGVSIQGTNIHNGGILLRTDGGSAERLDYYEIHQANVNFTGLFDGEIQVPCIFSRIGNVVTLTILGDTDFADCSTGYLISTPDSVPYRFLPAYTVYTMGAVIDNGDTKMTMTKIGANGIEFYGGLFPESSFTCAGQSGIAGNVFTYYYTGIV